MEWLVAVQDTKDSIHRKVIELTESSSSKFGLKTDAVS